MRQKCKQWRQQRFSYRPHFLWVSRRKACKLVNFPCVLPTSRVDLLRRETHKKCGLLCISMTSSLVITTHINKLEVNLTWLLSDTRSNTFRKCVTPTICFQEAVRLVYFPYQTTVFDFIFRLFLAVRPAPWFHFKSDRLTDTQRIGQRSPETFWITTRKNGRWEQKSVSLLRMQLNSVLDK